MTTHPVIAPRARSRCISAERVARASGEADANDCCTDSLSLKKGDQGCGQ